MMGYDLHIGNAIENLRDITLVCGLSAHERRFTEGNRKERRAEKARSRKARVQL